jgi:adenylate cyclase class 2
VIIRITKHCRNYRFEAGGRSMLASLVTVPEVDGTFVEVETQAEPADVAAALDAVRAVLTDLGIRQSDLTTEKSTSSVRSARKVRSDQP